MNLSVHTAIDYYDNYSLEGSPRISARTGCDIHLKLICYKDNFRLYGKETTSQVTARWISVVTFLPFMVYNKF